MKNNEDDFLPVPSENRRELIIENSGWHRGTGKSVKASNIFQNLADGAGATASVVPVVLAPTIDSAVGGAPAIAIGVAGVVGVAAASKKALEVDLDADQMLILKMLHKSPNKEIPLTDLRTKNKSHQLNGRGLTKNEFRDLIDSLVRGRHAKIENDVLILTEHYIEASD